MKKIPPIKNTYTSVFDSFGFFPKPRKIELGTPEDDLKAMKEDFKAVGKDFDKAMGKGK